MTTAWESAVSDRRRLAAVRRVPAQRGPDDALDRLTELAIELIDVPRACITVVDGKSTTARSIIGFPEGSPRSAPIELSFCRFVVGSGRPLIVEDARTDPRTRGDPAIALFQATAWAGYPLEDPDGAILGTFCLMDSVAHEWSPTDLHILATLAKAASSEVSLRIIRSEASSARRHLDELRLATAHDRAALLAHLEGLVGLGGPAGEFAGDLLAWLRG